MQRWSETALVILTWNGRELTLACLRSLAALELPVQLIIVDNGSTDGTAAAVCAAFPAVTVLETGENLGYAGGNNIGIRGNDNITCITFPRHPLEGFVSRVKVARLVVNNSC